MVLIVMCLDAAYHFLIFNFFRIAMIQLVLFFPLSHFSVEDDALCPFLGSRCKQMGKISIPRDSFGGFPTIWIVPIEDSPIADLKVGVGMATFPSPAPRGSHVFLRHLWNT